MAQIYGDILGTSCSQVLDHHPTTCPSCGVKKLFSEDLAKVVHEHVTIDKDGNSLWIELTATPIKDQLGNIIGALEVIMPITERKLTEERLKESEGQFRSLAEDSVVGIYSIDNRGIFRYVNNTFAEIIGYTRNEIIDKLSFREIVHPDDLQQIKFKERISGEIPSAHYELRAVCKDGRVISIEVHGSTVHTDQDIFIIGTVVDITSRKLTEERLRCHRELLEELNRDLERRVAEEVSRNREKDQMMLQQSRLAAMGEMIGNIAHQWRQPLNMLGIVVQRIQIEFEKEQLTKATLQEEVDRSLELLVYMSRTIDDFRDFFRFDKDPGQFTISAAVNKVVRFFIAAGYTLHIDTNIPEDLQVNGYFNEFCQVLLNIFNNARDALKERNTVEPLITVATADEAQGFTLTIRDNGGGIPIEILDRVFEPYFTTKDAAHGTGIGLYLSRFIIEKRMQGRITAGNWSDGAEFVILLPACDGQAGKSIMHHYREET